MPLTAKDSPGGQTLARHGRRFDLVRPDTFNGRG